MLAWKGRVGRCPDLLWLFPASCLGSKVSAHIPLHQVTQPFTKLLGQGWTNADRLGPGWPLGSTTPLPFPPQEKRVILPADSPILN